jgi:hypothetical protein
MLQSTFQQLLAAEAGGGLSSAAIPVETTAANRTTATQLNCFLIVHLLGVEITMPLGIREAANPRTIRRRESPVFIDENSH